jgi:hypothetical protein
VGLYISHFPESKESERSDQKTMFALLPVAETSNSHPKLLAFDFEVACTTRIIRVAK